jgi:preprotein translocase subunit SecG
MGIVSVILLIVFVIACVLLVLVVLVQDEHGEGLGGIFAGSSASYGPRKGSVLTRFTSILGAAFLVGAFAVAWLNRTPEIGDVVRKARLEQLKSGQQADWWVQSGASQTETTTGTTAAGASTGTQASAEAAKPDTAASTGTTTPAKTP